MGMILKKRQIVVSTLVLALGVAVFMNWYFAGSGAQLKATGVLDASKNLGDAQYVNSTTLVSEETTVANNAAAENTKSSDNSSDYFAQVRLNRQVARDKALEILKDIIASTDATENAKADAVSGAAVIANNVKLENDIESVVIAKGFADCVAVIEDGHVQVIVKSEKLLDSQILQIKEIVLKQAKVNVENISIIEAK